MQGSERVMEVGGSVVTCGFTRLSFHSVNESATGPQPGRALSLDVLIKKTLRRPLSLSNPRETSRR